MQKFKSHKVVEAAKITDIRYSVLDDKYDIAHIHGCQHVDHDWVLKHKPDVGGYIVVYPDGYTSYSPAAAFEEGYTPFTHDGALPVSGYKPQTEENVALVNGFKADEERILRKLDALANRGASSLVEDIDYRWIAIGRTSIEQGFMAINRAVFQPGRVKLPEDTVPFVAADVVNTPEAKAAFMRDAEASGDDGYVAHAKTIIGD
jgi:hypothetical protein